MIRPPRGEWRGWAAWAAVVAAVFAGFGSTLDGHFLGDDFAYVGRFTRFPWLAWPELFVDDWAQGMFGLPQAELRPIAALSFMIDARIWGINPAGYHLTNLALHLICSGLVMLIARVPLDGRWLPAAAAGVIFALHPVHDEAVAWITGRVDLLSAAGFLLGFYALLRFRHSASRRWLHIAWFAYAAGMFAKESALVLPVVALLYDLVGRRTAPPRRSDLVAPYLGWGVLAAGYLMLRITAFGFGLGGPRVDVPALQIARTWPAVR